jgi:hypothetical protein
MRFNVILPDITPEFSSYITKSGMITIQVGLIVDSVNSEVAFENRSYAFRDSTGKLVESGNLKVKLNTFETTISFFNLKQNSFYTFSLFNSVSGVSSSSVIATGDITDTIDETTDVSNSYQLEMTDTLSLDRNHVVYNPTSTFPDGLNLTENQIGSLLGNNVFLGNSLIVRNGKLLAYKPRVIKTFNRSLSSQITIIPFNGMFMSNVIVKQILAIKRIGRLRYSIEPSSTIKLTIGKTTIVFDSPTSIVDVANRVPLEDRNKPLFIEDFP